METSLKTKLDTWSLKLLFDWKHLRWGLLILLISALSAWRLSALVGDSRLTGLGWWSRWTGLLGGFLLVWLLALVTVRRLRPSRAHWFSAGVGAALFGIGGWLLTQPAGVSTLRLDLYAENVWSPTAFEIAWAGEGLSQAPLVLPISEPTPVTLDIVATGQADPAGRGAEVILLTATGPEGRAIPLDEFEGEPGWTREAISWGNYQGQMVWMAKGETPATLRWQGSATGPVTLNFAKNRLSGGAVIRRNGQTVQEINLYTRRIGLHSVTLPPSPDTATVWRSELPLTALDEPVSLTLRADPFNAFLTVFKEIRVEGLPGPPVEISGHRLAEVITVEHGWLELVPDGVRVRAADENVPPQLFLVEPALTASVWRWLLPWLENGLLTLYATLGGGLLLLMAVSVARLRPDLATNLNLLLITLLISLLLGEVALRFYLPPANRYYIWEPNLHFVFNPRPDLIPGVSGETNVVINGQGLRGDPLSGAADYHILALGGSTTEALYLDQHEAWPHLLQAQLNQEQLNGSGTTVWVGNGGRSGRNTREHVLQVAHLLPQQPELDALILLTGINDLGLRLEQAEAYDPAYLTGPAARQVLMKRAFDAYPRQDSNTQPRYQQTALWRLWQQGQPAATAQTAPETKIEVQDDDGSFLIERRRLRQSAAIRETLPDLTGALAEYRRNLNRIIDEAEAHGVRIILATQPALWRPDLTHAEQELLWFGWGPGFDYFYSVEALIAGLDAYNATLLDVCRARQVECIDLASALPRDTTVFYDDVHFNESGARQVSQIIGAYLLERAPFGED